MVAMKNGCQGEWLLWKIVARENGC